MLYDTKKSSKTLRQLKNIDRFSLAKRENLASGNFLRKITGMKSKQTPRSLTCVHSCISWSDSAEILVTSLAIVLAKKGQFSQGKNPSEDQCGSWNLSVYL